MELGIKKTFHSTMTATFLWEMKKKTIQIKKKCNGNNNTNN